MRFGRFGPAWLPELMAWFGDARSLRTWGGAPFRFPFTPTTFREDSKVDGIPTFALTEDDELVAAFGQTYPQPSPFTANSVYMVAERLHDPGP